MKIARKLMKIFGINADNNQRGVFGSMASGSPAYTTDPETIQSLANFEQGWFSAILGNNSPAIEDMNALQFLFSYQLAYLLQQGIPEWNVDTEYYTGSFCQVGGVIYKSLIDNNIGNPVTDYDFWTKYYDESQLKILVSLIMRNFTQINGYVENNFKSMCWSPSKKIFVAVAVSGTGNRVSTSLSGLSWSFGSSAADNNWNKVIWAEEIGLFIAVSTTGSGVQRCMTSPDGLAWTLRSMSTEDQWQDLSYSPELEMVIALGTSSSVCINYSYDGITWVTATAFLFGNPRAVAWSPKLGKFLAVQIGANTDVATSVDGKIWDIHSSTHHGFNNKGLCWSEELGIFCGVTSGFSQISKDGINWTSKAIAPSSAFANIIWVPELMVFVIFGVTVVPHYSYDGLNWFICYGMSEDITALAWSPLHNLLSGLGDDRSFYSL